MSCKTLEREVNPEEFFQKRLRLEGQGLIYSSCWYRLLLKMHAGKGVVSFFSIFAVNWLLHALLR